jgi:hypothetical protein
MPYTYLHPHRRARRTNGATQTFRRPSHATTPSGSTSQAHSRDTSVTTNAQPSNPGVYVPPHAQSGRNGGPVEGRYSRDQLLDLYREQGDSEEIKGDASNLYVGTWEPNLSNGSGGPIWGRRDDHGQGQSGVDLCWDKDGSILPLSLTDMTEEEKEVCAHALVRPLSLSVGADFSLRRLHPLSTHLSSRLRRILIKTERQKKDFLCASRPFHKASARLMASHRPRRAGLRIVVAKLMMHIHFLRATSPLQPPPGFPGRSPAR